MWLFRDPDFRAIWRQHPDRNFQSPADWVDDGDRTISPLRPAQDFESSSLEWVKRIEDLDMRALRTQGIVGGGVSIRMCTAWFPREASRLTKPNGFTPDPISCFPFQC
jgi:hypothetical protein